MSRRDKENTKKFNFLEFCQDICLDIVVTYLLAHIAWEKYIKGTQSNDTNTLFSFDFYVYKNYPNDSEVLILDI